MRLYVPDPLKASVRVSLPPEAAHRTLSVMRRKAGDALSLFNGRDGEWRGRIAEAGKARCVVEVEAQTRPQAAEPDLLLVFAPLKRDALDLLVEKATELGVSALQPVLTRRTVVDRVNLERMAAIAREAAEQCERLTVPEARPAAPLANVMGAWRAGRRLLYCDETREAPPVLRALGRTPAADWAILVGPEGGFAPEERRMLLAQPFTTAASLGPRILRAETAAIAAVALWQAAFGDAR
jgi:16S rRNA (uracil1498-N3)-methyltransferase